MESDSIAVLADVEAEQCVLGAMILDRDALMLGLERLGPESFYRDTHRAVWEAARRIAERNAPVDLSTIASELRVKGWLDRIGGGEYLLLLVNAVPTARNADAYVDAVLAQAVRRALQSAGLQIADLALSHDHEPNDAVREAEAIIRRIGQQDSHSELVHAGVEAYAVCRDVETRMKSTIMSGIPTGVPSLNRWTDGLQRGELTILGARPSIGKTTLAMWIARHAAQEGHGVAVFSLEMTRRSILRNLACSVSGLDSSLVKRGRISSEDVAHKFAPATQEVGSWPLWINDCGDATPFDVRARVQAVRAEHPVELVIVDYLQRMKAPPGVRAETERVRVGAVSSALKALAMELDVSMLVLCQLSREAEDSRPTLRTLLESGRIEADADVVLFMHRKREEKGTVVETELLCEKNRQDQCGSTMLRYARHCGRFAEIDATRQ